MFFCKYNDPIYVKMEKLEIIIRLASERNVDQVLLELKEYSQEVGERPPPTAMPHATTRT